MEDGPTFMGLPERWLDDPTWKCPNGHVSKWYIKSEAKGGDVCPVSSCGEFVRLCAPEEVEQARAGRFVLVHGDNVYVTSWDTWEEAEAAWPIPPEYRIEDGETGRVWHGGTVYDWEAAQT